MTWTWSPECRTASSRAVSAAAIVVAVLASLSMAAPARADDLDDYLERAAKADYAGRRVVVTMWNGANEAAVGDIEHAGGMMILKDGDTEVLIGGGKLGGTEMPGITFSSWSAEGAGTKYTTSEATPVTRLGRSARSVTIFEGDLKRATIVFDAVTWAPLTTEIYDGEGRLFRLSTFTEFGPVSARAYAALREQASDAYEVVPEQAGSTLPVRAAGYERLDTYLDADGIAHAFYGDGLFSFSVFEIPTDRVEPGLEGGTAFEVGGARYLVLVEPAEIWVSWQRGEIAFMLVGDVPPDHLIDVLSELPAPKGRSFIDKILGLFS